MTRPIINLADIELSPRPPGLAAEGPAAERYDSRMGAVAARIGARKLGYNVTAVPPGKRAFPAHNHHINEEMFLVLEGSGEIHIGESSYPIQKGDVIACPPGGKDTAHQIVNTGSAELRYLAVSTKLVPEIVEYPTTGKFGVLAELATHAGEAPRMLRYVGREDQGVPYWEGE